MKTASLQGFRVVQGAERIRTAVAGVGYERSLTRPDEQLERCPDCGGEIVWHPKHGERCDSCRRPV